jgi:hypothetical protein
VPFMVAVGMVLCWVGCCCGVVWRGDGIGLRRR